MLYIFDLDSTLVEAYGIAVLPGVAVKLHQLVNEGHALSVATNQAGPAWRFETADSKYPLPSSLGERFQLIAEALPVLARAQWYIAVADARLSLSSGAYEQIIRAFSEAAGTLAVHLSADLTWRKPAPGMLLAACADYQSPVAHTVFVGDADSDAAAAKAAGIGFVLAARFFGWPSAENSSPRAAG